MGVVKMKFGVSAATILSLNPESCCHLLHTFYHITPGPKVIQHVLPEDR